MLVLLGLRLAGIEQYWGTPVWRTTGAMWSITAFGYLTNDLFDRAEDSINKPDRPLPAGRVTTPQAVAMAVCLVLLTLALVFPLDGLALASALLVLGLLVIYNAWLKGTPGGGNLVIALLAGAALFPGVIVIAGWRITAVAPLLLPAFTLSGFIFAREVLKTLEDHVGDRGAGKATLPNVIGIDGALFLFTVVSLLTVGLSILAWWVLHYSTAYLLCVLVGVDLPLVVALLLGHHQRIAIHADGSVVRFSLALLKGAYFVGLLALWLA
jgi:geranylgeranylglycerol-phosphate geranylgeranyltransferase